MTTTGNARRDRRRRWQAVVTLLLTVALLAVALLLPTAWPSDTHVEPSARPALLDAPFSRRALP